MIAGMIGSSAYATTISYDVTTDYVYLPGQGAYVPTASNWVFACYVSADATINAFGTGDDVLLWTKTTWADNGYFTGSFTHPGGSNIFFRVYDAANFVNDSSIGSATRYINLLSGISAVPAGDNSLLYPSSGSIDLIGTTSGASWQAIPEPGMMGLLTIGGICAFWRNRKRRK